MLTDIYEQQTPAVTVEDWNQATEWVPKYMHVSNDPLDPDINAKLAGWFAKLAGWFSGFEQVLFDIATHDSRKARESEVPPEEAG